MPIPTAVQVVTRRPDGTRPKWLGQYGHVTGLQLSHSVPGGPDQLSCILQASTAGRPTAIQAGRQVQAYAGVRCIWDGQLDEPTPGGDGWQLTAHGAGAFGQQFNAIWTATWASGGAPSDAVDQAITRGMRWVNPGFATPPAGAWMGQVPDNGSLKISDVLNLLCSRGGLTWQVKVGAGGNRLQFITVPVAPVTPTRLLVATGPVARTMGGVVNAITLRYQNNADTSSGVGSFTTTTVTNSAMIALYGRTEQFMDISNAGTMTAAAAQAVGNWVLNRYQQASFGGPFTVYPGQYLTNRGSRIHLATEQAGEIVRLLVADWGGAVSAGVPTTFLVGNYAYDEESGTAQVTPFNTVRTDFSTLAGVRTDFHSGKGDPFGLKGSHI
jgi:hypothetical protein